MGKKKSHQVFIPGFTCLGKSIYLQDPTLVAHTPYPQPKPLPPMNEGRPPEVPRIRPPEPSRARRPHLSFTASSNPFPLPSASEASTHDTPDLILLTPWTGAQARHIAKYTLSYNQLYPGTPMLIITTTITDLALRRLKTKLEALAPAVAYLTTSPKSNILLHAFSEGGAHKAVCLARAYLAATDGARLPVRAFLLDSTPGTPRYTSNVAAFKRSLPRHPVARALGLPVGASVLGVHWFLFSLFVGYDNNIISQTRRALNDDALWEDVRAPRTYLFSEGDDLIDWHDVERHGKETAEALGVRSLLVKFKESGHCGHARGNEGLYWGAVRRTWDSKTEAVRRPSWGSGRVGDLVLSCVCCGEKLGG